MQFGLVLLYTVSYYIHLTSRIPALGSIRFDFIIIVALLFFSIFRFMGNPEIISQKIVKSALVFIVYCIVTIPLVKWPGSVIHYGFEQFLKGAAFFFIVVAFIDSIPKLQIFIGVFILCQLIRAFEPAYLHITQGYWGDIATDFSGGEFHVLDRLSGAPHDVVNPNQLAWVINTVFVFIYYLGITHKKKIMKIISLVVACGLLYPLLLTGSRSGIVIILAIVIGIIALGENRAKRFIIIFVIGLPIAIIAMKLLSPDMAERYLSLVDSNAVGAGTTAGRIQGLKDNFSTILNAHILFGHGLGTSLEVNVYYLGSALYAHNLYIEILQEVGILGFVLFFRYVYFIIDSLRKNDGLDSESEFIQKLIRGLKVWIFMDLIYSLSCFGLTSWEWYLFGAIAAVCLRIILESRSGSNRNEAVSKV